MYRIDEIDFNLTPEHRFKLTNGDEISFKVIFYNFYTIFYFYLFIYFINLFLIFRNILKTNIISK